MKAEAREQITPGPNKDERMGAGGLGKVGGRQERLQVRRKVRGRGPQGRPRKGILENTHTFLKGISRYFAVECAV